MTRPFLPGVLLDGHECSGKSTVARLLADELRARGHAVTHSHSTLTTGGLVESMLHEAIAVFEGAEDRPFRDLRLWRRFNSVRSAQLVVDAELAAQQAPAGPGHLRVQDRYWLSQHAFNTHLTPGEGYLSAEWIRTRAPRFAVQVYLTCSPDARRARASAREGLPAKHAVNTFLRRHFEETMRLDELSLGHIAGDPEWTVLWSDRCTAPELVEQVLGLLDAAGPSIKDSEDSADSKDSADSENSADAGDIEGPRSMLVPTTPGRATTP